MRLRDYDRAILSFDQRQNPECVVEQISGWPEPMMLIFMRAPS